VIDPDTLPSLHPGDWTVIHQDEGQQWIVSDEAEEIHLYRSDESEDWRRIPKLVIPFHGATFSGSMEMTEDGRGTCFTCIGYPVPIPVALYILEKWGWKITEQRHP